MSKLTTHVLLFAAVATFCSAQDEPPMPKPTPEHQVLLQSVGTWDATIEMPGEDGKPVTSKGVSEIKAGPGGFWTVDDMKAEMMGMPFTGHGVTGYDPGKGKYVATWVDSFSPSLLVMEGTYDKKTKALTMTAESPMGTMKTVSTHKDADTMVFEMYMVGDDGSEQKQMTITYKRQKGGKTGGSAGR